MVVIFSEIVVSWVKIFLDNCGKGIGLCFGVKIIGCLGMVYVFEFVDDFNEEDYVFESYGVKVIIDIKSMVYLDGI